MRIASRFQRAGRSNDRRARALTAGTGVVALSFGCFFELEPLEEPGGIGGGGDAGSLGGEAGDSSLGGDGGGGGVPMFPGCAGGLKNCGNGCVPVGPENGCGDPACTPCAPLANAATPTCGGDSGRCQVASCNAGYADCDGDLLDYTGEAGPNGCEYSFGTIEGSPQVLAVPRTRIIVGDGTRDDWVGIPAYALEQTCVDCEDDGVAKPSAQNEAPPPSDLSAYFRVAWDGDFFYVLAEAFDDHVFSSGSTLDDGRCRSNGDDYVPGPICEDAFAVFFDGRQDGGNYGNVDHRLFLGTSGGVFAPAQGQPPAGTIGIRVLPPPGPRCYRMEAQLPWTLLVSNQGEPVAGKFPPAADQTYGFDLAVSDWDPSISDQSILERQSQLFWTPRAPQSELHPSIAGVGVIVLTDHSPSEVAGSPQ
jgi:hypothetical protein